MDALQSFGNLKDVLESIFITLAQPIWNLSQHITQLPTSISIFGEAGLVKNYQISFVFSCDLHSRLGIQGFGGDISTRFDATYEFTSLIRIGPSDLIVRGHWRKGRWLCSNRCSRGLSWRHGVGVWPCGWLAGDTAFAVPCRCAFAAAALLIIYCCCCPLLLMLGG